MNEYRGFIIEWDDHFGCYRVYRKEHPEQTCVYCADEEMAKTLIDWAKEDKTK